MIGHETTMSIIFTFVNFGALVALGIYLFRRYSLADIKQAIADKFALMDQLKDRKDTLRLQQRELEHQLADQEALSKELLIKLDRWKQAHQHMVEERQQEQEQIYQSNRVHLEKQALYNARNRVYKQIMPLALERATKELTEHFAGEGKSYIKSIVHSIEREVHDN